MSQDIFPFADLFTRQKIPDVQFAMWISAATQNVFCSVSFITVFLVLSGCLSGNACRRLTAMSPKVTRYSRAEPSFFQLSVDANSQSSPYFHLSVTIPRYSSSPPRPGSLDSRALLACVKRSVLREAVTLATEIDKVSWRCPLGLKGPSDQMTIYYTCAVMSVLDKIKAHRLTL